MIIEIGNAKEGMVLRSAVTDSMGRTLLHPGDKLTGRHIEKLAAWEIRAIDIDEPEGTDEMAPEELADKIDQEYQKRLMERLDQRFAGTQNDELMAHLRRLAGEYLKRSPDLWDLTKSEEEG